MADITAPNATAPKNKLDLYMSGDSWEGSPQFVLKVDSVQIGDVRTVSALLSQKQVGLFRFEGAFGAGPHTVEVSFINDAKDPVGTGDRNLYVRSIYYDGVKVPGSSAALMTNGTAVFTIAGAAPAPTPEPVPVPTPVPAPAPSLPLPVPVASSGVASAAAMPAAGADNGVGLVAIVAPTVPVGSRVLSVGVGKAYATIAAAVAAAQDGDTVLVDAGTYNNDFTVVTSKISMLAVGGRVFMTADVPPTNRKGIVTVDNDVRIEGFSFSGARISDADGHNGAGIRYEGGQMVLVNDEFRDNQNGILAPPVLDSPANTIVIDHCLFDGNGGADPNGVGNIHNAYIGAVKSLVVTNSVFENALVGHELKSRAQSNVITNNLFVSGVGAGTGSYDIDLPNGGATVIRNNTVVKGPNAENTSMIHYGGESLPYPGSSLVIENNLLQNSRDGAIGVLNSTAISATIRNNVLSGLGGDALARGPATITGTFDAATGARLPDAALVGVLPGHTATFTDTANHAITLDGNSIQAVQGGAGRLIVNAQGGHVVAIGGAGGMDLTESATSGGNQFTTAAGSTNTLNLLGVGMNLIDSAGTDLIIAGSGNQVGRFGGTATVQDGSGDSKWDVAGHASIISHGGSTVVTVGPAATAALSGDARYVQVLNNGGQVSFDQVIDGTRVSGSIDGGAADMRVYGGRMNVKTAGGDVGATLRFGTGNLQLMSAGADKVFLGSGDANVILSGSSEVHVGTGQTSIYGRGIAGRADVYGNGGTVVLDGDTGNITYHGGDLASTVTERLGNVTLLGGAGRLTVNGGGHITVAGGSGGLTFTEDAGSGNWISTAAGSHNILSLQGADTVESHGNDMITTAGGNQSMDIYGDAAITLGDGNSRLTLRGADTVNGHGGVNWIGVTAGAEADLTMRDLTRVHSDGGSVHMTFLDPAAPSANVATVRGAAFDMSTDRDIGISVATGPGGSTNVALDGGRARVDSNGADAIHLGSGNATVVIHDTGADVWAGSGTLTLLGYNWGGGSFAVHGGSGTVTADQASSTMAFIGGTGAATLSGGQIDVTAGAGDVTVRRAQLTDFRGGTGHADLEIDSRGSHVSFGAGSTVVHATPWGGANVYAFVAGAGGGHDVIDGFKVGVDRIDLSQGVGVASTGVSNGSARVLLTDGTDLTFVGLTSTQGIFA